MEERRLKKDMTLFHILIQEGPRNSILHRATISKKGFYLEGLFILWPVRIPFDADRQ
jgi:hypothetical protein